MTHVPKVNHVKWDHKPEPCILIGYSEHSKAYCMFNPKNRQGYESRDVMILNELPTVEVLVEEETNSTAEPMHFTRVDQQGIKDVGQDIAVLGEQQGVAEFEEDSCSERIERSLEGRHFTTNQRILIHCRKR